MRNRIRRLEQRADQLGGYAYIPQQDGPPRKVTGEEWLEAFSVSTKRMYNKDIPEHPLAVSAANSPDPKWSRSLIAGTYSLPNGAERVGKPYEK